MLTTLRPLTALFLASCLLAVPTAGDLPGFANAVWADDDDDDGDDGDDDGGDRAGGSPGRGGNPFRSPFQPRRSVPAQPQPVALLAERVEDEIVALALNDADLTTLLAEGFGVIEERELAAFGVTSRRLSPPRGTALEAARDRVRLLASGREADFNHYYRPEQGFDEDCKGSDCLARFSIGWPLVTSRAASCARSAQIGMIDTGINADHPTFDGARIEVHRRSDEVFDPSRAVHGTAVAALLVGDPGTRSPGLVPGARLVAVDAFHRAGSDERADVFTLIDALDFLARQGVRVINLSLAGPPNAVLADTVDRLTLDRNIVLVAAAGNGGPRAEPVYPAAYAPVIAVTAVDREGNIYRRAAQGAYIDVAAPGVDVWTAASVSGARWKTGTSFAVPFVTAAAAILREERPELSALAISDEIRRNTRDLGAPGLDEVYGAGLLRFRPVCGGPI